ncbi:sigma-54 dependent transcriptional regulator [Myxococcota bacterium]|nr:sigma-54 dependent transcriptional regulator [Myxococcota bacterium]
MSGRDGRDGKGRILVVDDEAANREALQRILARDGYDVESAASGDQALAALRASPFDLLLTDLKMPRMDGVELLRAARVVAPDVEAILMTAYGTVEVAVEAMKEGAYDFLTKPLKRHELLRAVEKALEKRSLLAENRELRARLREKDRGREGPLGRIIGHSDGLRRVLDVVRQVAPAQATVLITGESGTGKELIAEALHHLSPRAQGPMVKLACAALPETLLESELFGHEAGAFTGATGLRKGRFELADGGTLFLDEVAEMSAATQVKLLRVLQQGEIERVGGSRTLRVDVRIVAATHRDLQAEVKVGRFREDLYWRLHVIRIHLPPLRERIGDVPLLVDHFVRRFAERNGKAIQGVSPEAMDLLSNHAWPGNVRELENTIERAVVLCRGARIVEADLPDPLQARAVPSRVLQFPIGTPLREIERRAILETLREAGGDKALAAHLLGVATRTIYRRLEELRAESEAEPAGRLAGEGADGEGAGDEGE